MAQLFAGIPQTVPVYKLLVDHFLDDDTLHYADETIAYEGMPSEHMAPLNEAAEVRMRAMLDALDDEARRKAEMVGRPYRGRLTDLGAIIEQATRDEKVLAERAQTEIVRRAMPVVPDKPAPARPDMEPLAIRKQKTLEKSSVRGMIAPGQKQREVQAIHRPGHDRLSEKAPIEG